MRKILILTVISFSIQTLAIEKVIYGSDDRFENRRSPFSRFSSSIAAMIPNQNLKISLETGRYHIKKIDDLTSYRGIRTCEDVKFRSQPTVADCTGFLIDEQTLVTAGHCLLKYNQSVKNTKSLTCANSQWIFGYEDNDYFFGQLSFSSSDVFACDKIIEAKYNSEQDYAIIKLNKTTINRQNLALNSSEENYEVDSDVFVIGHPSGLPQKISGGATIKENLSKNKFVTNLDTFGGNSGSPVFNDFGEVIGILNSGEVDYVIDTEKLCYRPNKCDDYKGSCDKLSAKHATGESATKTHVIESYLKEAKN